MTTETDTEKLMREVHEIGGTQVQFARISGVSTAILHNLCHKGTGAKPATLAMLRNAGITAAIRTCVRVNQHTAYKVDQGGPIHPREADWQRRQAAIFARAGRPLEPGEDCSIRITSKRDRLRRIAEREVAI